MHFLAELNLLKDNGVRTACALNSWTPVFLSSICSAFAAELADVDDILDKSLAGTSASSAGGGLFYSFISVFLSMASFD
jgi:hypothetical protein